MTSATSAQNAITRWLSADHDVPGVLPRTASRRGCATHQGGQKPALAD